MLFLYKIKKNVIPVHQCNNWAATRKLNYYITNLTRNLNSGAKILKNVQINIS